MQHIVITAEGAEAALQAFVVPDTRKAIEKAVEAFLARLDEMDGDPDVEPNGDELDGNNLEDDFMRHADNGPGCPVADQGEYAATEWHTRGKRKDREPGMRPGVFGYHEDSEEDDGDTSGDEGEPDFSRQPKGYGPGCIISDNDFEHDGAEYEHDVEPLLPASDVPTLPVYSLEPNVFTGQRVKL